MKKPVVIFLLAFAVIATRLVAEVMTITPLRTENALLEQQLEQQLEQTKRHARFDAGRPIVATGLRDGEYVPSGKGECGYALVRDKWVRGGEQFAVWFSTEEIPDHFVVKNGKVVLDPK